VCWSEADHRARAATPVTEDYKEGDIRFTGTIHQVTVDLKEIKSASTETSEKDLREASSRRLLAD